MKRLLTVLLSAALFTPLLFAQTPCNFSIDLGDQCRVVYIGYEPLECTTITATTTGSGPFTYLWSTGETTQSITVCPSTATNYFASVTDANGCTVANGIAVFVEDVSCGHGGKKALVCHIPPGNPPNAHTICISWNGVPAHLAHGCHLGACEFENPCEIPEERPFAVASQHFQSDIDNMDHSVLTNHEADDDLYLEAAVWPNPGTDELNVQIPSDATGKVSVQLFSLSGQVLRSQPVFDESGFTVIENLNTLANGMYYIRIADSTGSQWMLIWTKHD